MKFQGAIVKEQGTTFGIIIVKPTVLHSVSERETMQKFGAQAYGSIPIVLMSQDSSGKATYYGRNDIVSFLSGVHLSQIPWRQYSLN